MRLGCIAAVAGALAARTAATDSHVVHETRDFVPHDWTATGPVEHDALHLVKIGLKQQNEQQAIEALESMTDPRSPTYGQHWTQGQVIAHFAPSPDTLERVTQWLTGAGIAQSRVAVSQNRAWLAFHATNGETERLLRTQFHWYRHPSSARRHAAATAYQLPRHLAEHIDFVTPGVLLAGAASQRRVRPVITAPMSIDIATVGNSTARCGDLVTPGCLAALYNFTLSGAAAVPTRQGNRSLGFFETGYDAYSQADLERYFATYLPHVANGTAPLVHSIDGGIAPVPPGSSAGPESDFDVEIGYAVAYPQTVTVYQVGAPADEGTELGVFNTFLDALDGSYCTHSAFGEKGNDPVYDTVYPSAGYNDTLQCGTLQPTNVISLSYGRQENQLPASYQQRQCLEFMKLGLQGVSVIAASGDYGVAGPTGTSDACLGPRHTVFSPTHPNSCPWVINVGGTQLPAGAAASAREVAALTVLNGSSTQYSSGGGFSNVFAPAKYQQAAIDAYFFRHHPPYFSYARTGDLEKGAAGFGRYNRSGRGIPDLSANWGPHALVVDGQQQVSFGTSGSAPVVAGLFSRLNEARLAMNKSTVGFFLPTLYQHPEVLHDIVSGSNPGCGTAGFSAVPGWDPVTGLGTPDFAKMLALAKALP